MKKHGKTKRERALDRLYGILPRAVVRELSLIAQSRRDFLSELSEVRLRAGGRSVLVIAGENYPLISAMDKTDIEECVYRITEGSVYAHRDTLASGYVPVGAGIRVGISGSARYNGSTLVGVGDVGSLVFRLPAAECDFADGVFSHWENLGCPNMIVGAPPSGGKTTLLAALAGLIGRHRRTVIADERCEFDPEDYRDALVDILAGYKREVGIEQATRTMSAEVIIADEIVDACEARAILSALGSGVTVITSVHAGELRDLYRRECLTELLARRAFGMAVIIKRRGGVFYPELHGMSGELLPV